MSSGRDVGLKRPNLRPKPVNVQCRWYQYREATAIFVRPATGAPRADTTGTLQTAPLGQRPSAVGTRTNEIIATVESIDYPSRVVVVKGPSGSTRTFKVGPEVKNLDGVRKGDEVVVRHTEAVAVAVTE
jgi:hypothetical protein